MLSPTTGVRSAVAFDGSDEGLIRLPVPSMDCASCAGKVRNAIERLDGIEGCQTRPTAGVVEVRYDPEVTDRPSIVAAIESAGYPVDRPEEGPPEAPGDGSRAREVWTSARAIKTWISGGLLAVGLVTASGWLWSDAALFEVLGRTIGLADGLFLAAVAVGGQEILANGLRSVQAKSLDIDLLMSIAILGALAASVGFDEPLYLEAATLAFLFSVAELLEQASVDRARASLRELMELAPQRARVRRDGATTEVPVDEVQLGETVLVRPGEKIPVDGEISEGASAVDQAPVTGESVPVDKQAGDRVFAGTLNGEGYLEIEVTAAHGEDTLSRVIEMVEQAQANRTERERFVDAFARIYTPVVVALAVLLALVPPLVFGGSWPTYIVYGLTLLVLACPCAFVISTPVSVVSGITSAARNGVLIKGGDRLEAMADVDVVAFDKTGTLTTGELTVTDVIALEGRSEEDVLRCARGIQARSEHPIGRAIVERAEGDTEVERAIDGFESLPGKGVRAKLGGTPHVAGKPSLFEELGFEVSHVHAANDAGTVPTRARELCERSGCTDLLEDVVPELEAQGKTVILVGTDAEVEGVIALGQRLRPEARRTIERLRELDVQRTVMITGDNERTAHAVADALGIDEVRAELLPDEKVQAIEDLVEEGGTVAMVGDGINDAPALAAASVGIAMGAAGTDAALETADVALMRDDLAALPYLLELSRAADTVIQQNIWTSLGAKGLLALGVPFGLVPIWAAVLVGDAGMTTAVTGNAMRLARIEPT